MLPLSQSPTIISSWRRGVLNPVGVLGGSIPLRPLTLPARTYSPLTYSLRPLLLPHDRRHLAHPDVAEPHRVAVVLQLDRQFDVVLVVLGRPRVRRVAEELEMILNHHAVVQRRDERRRGE